MPYNPNGQYQPVTLIENIISTTESAPLYQLTLSYLQALKTQVLEATTTNIPSTAGNKCQDLINKHGGHTCLAHKRIEDVLSRYANTALGRTIGAAFVLFVQLCRPWYSAKTSKISAEILELLRRAQAIVQEFHRSEDVWTLEEDLSALNKGEREKVVEIRRHVRSMEVCVEGLRVWGDMIGG